jgi:superoxide dismutase
MKPGGGGIPSGKLAGAIDKSFGSYANFKKEVNCILLVSLSIPPKSHHIIDT